MTKAIFKGLKGKNKFRGPSLVDMALVTWQRIGDVNSNDLLAEGDFVSVPF